MGDRKSIKFYCGHGHTKKILMKRIDTAKVRNIHVRTYECPICGDRIKHIMKHKGSDEIVKWDSGD